MPQNIEVLTPVFYEAVSFDRPDTTKTSKSAQHAVKNLIHRERDRTLAL